MENTEDPSVTGSINTEGKLFSYVFVLSSVQIAKGRIRQMELVVWPVFSAAIVHQTLSAAVSGRILICKWR